MVLIQCPSRAKRPFLYYATFFFASGPEQAPLMWDFRFTRTTGVVNRIIYIDLNEFVHNRYPFLPSCYLVSGCPNLVNIRLNNRTVPK